MGQLYCSVFCFCFGRVEEGQSSVGSLGANPVVNSVDRCLPVFYFCLGSCNVGAVGVVLGFNMLHCLWIPPWNAFAFCLQTVETVAQVHKVCISFGFEKLTSHCSTVHCATLRQGFAAGGLQLCSDEARGTVVNA